MKLRTLATSAAMVASMMATTAPAGPAGAVGSTLPYTCQVLGQTRTFSAGLDTDAPTRLAYAQTAPTWISLTLTLPEDVTATIRDDLRAATVEGTASVAGKVGKKQTPWAFTFPRTTVPPTGSLVLIGSVPSVTFTGRKIDRMWRIRAGDLATSLRFYRADGQPTSPIPAANVACALPAGQAPLVSTVTVVKDTTTTTVIGKDTAKGSRGRAKVKVASTYGTTPRGDVRVKVFHRGEKVAERVLALKRGKVKLRTRRLTERGWSVTAKYLGNDVLRGSHGSDKIKVR